MSNQIEQIRAEIKRLIKHNAEHPKDEITADVYEYALQDVLEILDKYEQAHHVPAEESPNTIAEEDDARERQRNGLPAYSPVLNQASLDKKIDAFSEAHKGETAEQIEAACRGEEAPIEVCGKKVVVRYTREGHPCDKCVLDWTKECDPAKCSQLNERALLFEGGD